MEPFSDAKVPKLSQDVSDKSGSSVESMTSAMLETDKKEYITFDECERDALVAVNTSNQDSFFRIVLQSPSPYSYRLGVLFAAKLNWCTALRSLLLATQTSPNTPTDKSDILSDHPLFTEYFRQNDCNFSTDSSSKTFLEEFALLRAATEGFSQVVRVLVEFIDPNFYASSVIPSLGFVYMNKDEASRRECLRVILPKLELSDKNLTIAAENGDLPSVMYLVDKMKVSEEFLYVRAVRMAIEHGHDDVAKWIISQPGLIPWEDYAGGILLSAAQAQNVDLLVYLSQTVLELIPPELGPITVNALWKFLKDKDQALYRKFAPHDPDGYVLYP